MGIEDDNIEEFLIIKVILLYISLVFLLRRLQNTKNILRIIIILLIAPLPFVYNVYENPEIPEKPSVPFYSQEYGWRYIFDSGDEKIVSGRKIFYLESGTIPQYEFGFAHDLSEISFIDYEISESWVKIGDELRELKPENKYEDDILSVILTIPEMCVTSGEKVEIMCSILLKRKKLPDEVFIRGATIPKLEIQDWPGKKISIVGISLPKKYRLIKISSEGLDDTKGKIKSILFSEHSEDFDSYGIIFINLEKDVKEDRDIVFYFHISPSENEDSLLSGQDFYFYDSIEFQVEMLDKEYWIRIRAHVSNISNEPIDSVMNPLIYFVDYPEDLKVQKYNLNNGSILQDKEEYIDSDSGKIAWLERKDGLPIFKPGEDTWIEIEAILPHELDLTRKKIFDMPLIPVIVSKEGIQIIYELKLPSSATKILTGFPKDYLLKEENLLEWNYRDVRLGDVYFFGTSFVNNVRLPDDNPLKSNLFLSVFFISWIIFIGISYLYQNPKILLPLGLSFPLMMFFVLINVINPLDVRFLQDSRERLKMSLLWAYTFTFPFVSVLTFSLRKFLEKRKNELRSHNWFINNIL